MSILKWSLVKKSNLINYISSPNVVMVVRSEGRKEIWSDFPSFLQWLQCQWWDNMILRLLIICSLFKEKFLVRYDAVTQQTGEKTLGHWLGHLEHVFGHILGLFEHILTNHNWNWNVIILSKTYFIFWGKFMNNNNKKNRIQNYN